MLVIGNAMCMCTFGTAPSPLEVLPMSLVFSTQIPAGNIGDAIPFAEVQPFALCTSLANPAVAAATAAALGVLTPMPCTPVTSAWIPGAMTTLLGKKPALDQESIAICAYGGVISITFPGEVTVMLP